MRNPDSNEAFDKLKVSTLAIVLVALCLVAVWKALGCGLRIAELICC